MQKNIAKIFRPPPLRAPKIQPPPLAMKSMDQPHRKACKLNFYCKICGKFFKAPLARAKTFKGPLLASDALKSVCERSLTFNSYELTHFCQGNMSN